MSTYSVCVITADEACHLGDCLEPFVGRAEIVIVDAGSRDGTLEIARRLTPHVYSLPFIHFSHQRNYALEQATGEWVFFIDADERAPRELVSEIEQVVRRGGPENGFTVRRQNHFLGRPVRHGGNEGDEPLRLFRRSEGRYFNAVHETPGVRGRIGRLRSALTHFSTQNVRDYWAKLDLYTARSVWDALERRAVPSWLELWAKPLAKFFWLYGVRRGFLDGRAGLAYSTLSAWYSFVEARAVRRAWREGGASKGPRDVIRRNLKAALMDGERRHALEPLLDGAGVPYDVVPRRSVFGPEEYPIALLPQRMERGMGGFFNAYQEAGGIVMDLAGVRSWDSSSLAAAVRSRVREEGLAFALAGERQGERFTAEWRRRHDRTEIEVRRQPVRSAPLKISVWAGGESMLFEVQGSSLVIELSAPRLAVARQQRGLAAMGAT